MKECRDYKPWGRRVVSPRRNWELRGKEKSCRTGYEGPAMMVVIRSNVLLEATRSLTGIAPP